MALDVFYLNIEHGKNLDLTLGKAKEFDSDVFAFLEVDESINTKIKKELGVMSNFVPMAETMDESIFGVPLWESFGQSFFVKPHIEILETGSDVYHFGTGIDREKDGIPDMTGALASINRVLQWIRLKKEETEYLLLLTHFTWSPDSTSTPEQKEHIQRVLDLIDRNPTFSDGFVFMGDLNSPRKNEFCEPYSPEANRPIEGSIWRALEEKYTDNIPPEVCSTIDPDLHRNKELVLCVDFCFTHGDHIAKNVKVISGVSDHCGVHFTLEKA